MRIIGGRFRGKRLQSPDDHTIRPTSDRVRESLFNVLDHNGAIAGMRFLDLFCGTGAVGLEAYSRGAEDVWLMDQDIGLANANLRRFNHPPGICLHHQGTLARSKPPFPFDVAFLDPPYGKCLLEPVLSLLQQGWLAPSCWVVVERSVKEVFEVPAGFFVRQERTYGRASITFMGVGSHEPADRQ